MVPALLQTEVFVVTPTLATQNINITSTSNAPCSIYNTNGTLILETTQKQIDISNLPNGMYILKQLGNTAKFVKE